MGRYVVRLVAAGIAALTLVACSSSDGSGNGKGANGAAASTTLATTANTPPQPVDTKFSGAGSEEYCKLARVYADAQSKLTPGSTSPDLRQLFRDAAQDIKSAVAVAPAEIKSDVQIVADGFNALVAALEPVNYDFTRLTPDLIARFMSADFTAASTRVAAYSRNVCGVS